MVARTMGSSVRALSVHSHAFHPNDADSGLCHGNAASADASPAGAPVHSGIRCSPPRMENALKQISPIIKKKKDSAIDRGVDSEKRIVCVRTRNTEWQ